jgi:putative two-component system response regulator
MICDQYDALRSRRPYKLPLSHAETVTIIIQGDGRTMPEHFDPGVFDAFRKHSAKLEEIFETRTET